MQKKRKSCACERFETRWGYI